MTQGFSTTVSSACPDETANLAASIAPVLVAGDTILLKGQVGAGKSHFARSLIQARLASAGLHEDIPSPTYTLVQTYDDGLAEIWHCDLYRLFDANEISELGLQDAFENSICLVEWPDRLASLAPENALIVDIASGTSECSRVLTFSAETGHWDKLGSLLDREKTP